MYENEETIDLSDIFRIVRKYIKFLIIIPIILAIFGFLISKFLISPVYESSTTILVNSSKTQQETLDKTNVDLSKSLIYTYTEIVKSEIVKQKTIKQLGITKDDIEEINASPVKDTQIIKIQVKSKDKELTPKIANTLATEFSKEVYRIAKVDSVELIDVAGDKPEKVKPSVVVNTLIAGLLGLMISLFLVFMKEMLDKTIKTEDDVRKHLDIDTLGAIAKYNCEDDFKLEDDFKGDKLSFSVREAYNDIRSTIKFANVDNKIKKIMVTSSKGNEGKTLVVSNLAYSMSNLGYKVILIDCDLRNPSIHRKFGISNKKGITDLLLEKCDYKKYINKINDKLDLLTSGTVPKNPSELLSSDAMINFIDTISVDYDYVFIDNAPMIVTDPVVMAKLVDGIIFIVESGVAQIDATQKCIDRLSVFEAPILGAILNKIDVTTGNSYYYYYGSYGKHEHEHKNKYKNKTAKA